MSASSISGILVYFFIRTARTRFLQPALAQAECNNLDLVPKHYACESMH